MKSVYNTIKISFLACVICFSLMGCKSCQEEVPAGHVAKLRTSSGWNETTLNPGWHSCWGRDRIYIVQTTQGKHIKKASILVGGKINLEVSLVVRCGANANDSAKLTTILDKVTSRNDGEYKAVVSEADMYKIYVDPLMDSIPRDVIGVYTDVESVLANKKQIKQEIRKQMVDALKTTPMQITLCDITNWDWPETITNAQTRIAEAKLKEQEAEAEVRANLQKAKGDLKVAEARKLVEMKEAEAIAEANRIIGESLAENPGYLQWHQNKMLTEAAKGPNNAFILIPYGTPLDSSVNSAQLKQILDSKNK